MQTVRAVLLGIPLPVCSCGVIPISATLRQKGPAPALPQASCSRRPRLVSTAFMRLGAYSAALWRFFAWSRLRSLASLQVWPLKGSHSLPNLDRMTLRPSQNPAVAAHRDARHRVPRLRNRCPRDCGFNDIRIHYASARCLLAGAHRRRHRGFRAGISTDQFLGKSQPAHMG